MLCALPIGCELAYDVELDVSLSWAAIVQLGYQPATYRHRLCVEQAAAELDTDELDRPELSAALAEHHRSAPSVHVQFAPELIAAGVQCECDGCRSIRAELAGLDREGAQ